MTMATLPSGARLATITSEYREVPGLKLTAKQACRFWSLGPEESRAFLDKLVDAQVLRRTADGHYVTAGQQ